MTYHFPYAGSALTGIEDERLLQRTQFELGNEINPALADHAYLQYVQSNSDHAAQALANAPDFYQTKGSLGSSLQDRDVLQKAYLEALVTQQKQQHDLQLAKTTARNHRNMGNLGYGMRMPYTGIVRANTGIPPVRYGTPMFHEEKIARFTSTVRTSAEAPIGPWFSTSSSNIEANSGSSLLDEFKNNKTKSFELSDILGHVVEFR